MAISTIEDWVVLDPVQPIPIHTQIKEQIKLALARGHVERGSRLPTIRALARTLDIHPNTVARAYASLVLDGVLVARPGRGTFVAQDDGGPGLQAEREARLNSIATEALVEALSLGFPPEQVEASFALRLARLRQEASRTGTVTDVENEPDPDLVMAGSHDLAFELLTSHLRRHSGLRTIATYAGSLAGLMALARGEAHVAGCHLLDEESGEYNLPFVRRVLVGEPVVVVILAQRKQGLLVPRGNPNQIEGLEGVIKRGLRYINRQKGSGTRVLLDFLLRQNGIDSTQVVGYGEEVETHLAVAEAVATSHADAGLGILAAARAFDLDFIPVRDERYDLVLTRRSLVWPQVKAMRGVLEGQEFKDSVNGLGGYDTSRTGDVLAEVDG